MRALPFRSLRGVSMMSCVAVALLAGCVGDASDLETAGDGLEDDEFAGWPVLPEEGLEFWFPEPIELFTTGPCEHIAPLVLAPGQSIKHCGGDGTQLIMQADGNLVLYVLGEARWSTATHGNPGAWAAFQADGNLVVYAGTA